MSDSSIVPAANNFCETPYHCSKSTKSVAILIATAIAVAAIEALAIGLLANCGIIIGLNSIVQWILIGTGASVAFVATVIGGTCLYNLGWFTEEDFNALTLKELQQKLDAISKEDNPIEAI